MKNRYRYMIYNKVNPCEYISGSIFAESMDAATLLVQGIAEKQAVPYKIREIRLEKKSTTA